MPLSDLLGEPALNHMINKWTSWYCGDGKILLQLFGRPDFSQ